MDERAEDRFFRFRFFQPIDFFEFILQRACLIRAEGGIGETHRGVKISNSKLHVPKKAHIPSIKSKATVARKQMGGKGGEGTYNKQQTTNLKRQENKNRRALRAYRDGIFVYDFQN